MCPPTAELFRHIRRRLPLQTFEIKVGRMIAKNNNCKTSLKSTLKLDSRGGCMSSSLSPVKGFEYFRQQVLINKTNVTKFKRASLERLWWNQILNIPSKQIVHTSKRTITTEKEYKGRQNCV